MIKQKFSKRLGRKMWGFDVRLGGQRVRDYSYRSREEAESVLLMLKVKAAKGEYGIYEREPSPLFSELAALRLKAAPSLAERRRSARVLDSFAALLPSGVRVTDITGADLRRWVEWRESTGVRATSINRELNIIGATLHSGPELFPQLEQWRCPKLPRPKVSQRRRERVISGEEIDKLLAYLLAPARDGEQERQAYDRRTLGEAFLFSLLTGMRRGEVARLQWRDVDWQGGVIKAVGTKTDRDRYLPISAPVHELLKARRKASASLYVFTDSGRLSSTTYYIMRRACEACGIAYGRNVAGGLVPHDARHTFVTRLLQAGTDIATVQGLSGHSTKFMALYYSHPTAASREEAMGRLAETLGLRTDANAGGTNGPPQDGLPEGVVRLPRRGFQFHARTKLS
jgi:integrase